MKPPLRKALLIAPAVLVLAFVVWIIFTADKSGQVPVFLTALYAFPNGDKVGHFLLMGAVAFTLALALPRRAQLPGLALLSLLLAAEEFSQRFFGRHSTWPDLLCSLAGVLVLGGLGIWLTRKKSPKM